MKAIARKLLIHSVMYEKKQKEDKFGNVADCVGTSLRFVRLEPLHKVVSTKDNRQVTISATLFYDCKNSMPKMHEFNYGDTVVFCGHRYEVATIEPIYALNLHHFEVGLI